MGRKAQRRGGRGGRRKGRNKTTNEKGPKLRFKYGDRVECCMGEDPESPGIGLWKVGTGKLFNLNQSRSKFCWPI